MELDEINSTPWNTQEYLKIKTFKILGFFKSKYLIGRPPSQTPRFQKQRTP